VSSVGASRVTTPITRRIASDVATILPRRTASTFADGGMERRVLAGLTEAGVGLASVVGAGARQVFTGRGDCAAEEHCSSPDNAIYAGL